jgi:hypothetical protein
MNRFAFIAALAALGAVATPARSAVQAGMLECRAGPRLGLIVGSFQKLDCVFKPSSGHRPQRYAASEGRIGLDIGISAGAVMAWAVFAPSDGIAPGALAGHYAGVSADIALGLGVAANALIGGSHRSVALQPLSIEGQVGVNLAAGISGFTLRHVH